MPNEIDVNKVGEIFETVINRFTCDLDKQKKQVENSFSQYKDQIITDVKGVVKDEKLSADLAVKILNKFTELVSAPFFNFAYSSKELIDLILTLKNLHQNISSNKNADTKHKD